MICMITSYITSVIGVSQSHLQNGDRFIIDLLKISRKKFRFQYFILLGTEESKKLYV